MMGQTEVALFLRITSEYVYHNDIGKWSFAGRAKKGSEETLFAQPDFFQKKILAVPLCFILP
jgi:hypothetical protein